MSRGRQAMLRLAGLGFAGVLAASGRAAEIGDPTRPALSASAPAPVVEKVAAPTLTSVIVSPRERIAVIDGRRVRIGDRIGAGEVVAIELSGVRLQREEGDLVLKLSAPARRVKKGLEEGR